MYLKNFILKQIVAKGEFRRDLQSVHQIQTATSRSVESRRIAKVISVWPIKTSGAWSVKNRKHSESPREIHSKLLSRSRADLPATDSVLTLSIIPLLRRSFLGPRPVIYLSIYMPFDACSLMFINSLPAGLLLSSSYTQVLETHFAGPVFRSYLLPM